LRGLAATIDGPDRAAGYMTLARSAQGLLLAPVPHGAPVAPGDSRALIMPAGTWAGHAAIARFQLMAALGLARHTALTRGAPRVLVLGGGPVATGCALELRRLGVPDVAVATRHPAPACACLPGVTVTAEPGGPAPVVIDCTGRAAAALRFTAPGGFLGLLGTPGDDAPIPAAAVHRSGTVVAGMHELAAFSAARYQAAFTDVLDWVTTTVSTATAMSWCRQVPGQDAPALYARLPGGHRPPEPFLILTWEAS
jgi:threonine dehydrogenase-like Zn-dependent dehydrogenase